MFNGECGKVKEEQKKLRKEVNSIDMEFTLIPEGY